MRYISAHLKYICVALVPVCVSAPFDVGGATGSYDAYIRGMFVQRRGAMFHPGPRTEKIRKTD
jgi:hypothetical protein